MCLQLEVLFMTASGYGYKGFLVYTEFWHLSRHQESVIIPKSEWPFKEWNEQFQSGSPSSVKTLSWHFAHCFKCITWLAWQWPQCLCQTQRCVHDASGRPWYLCSWWWCHCEQPGTHCQGRFYADDCWYRRELHGLPILCGQYLVTHFRRVHF